MSNYLCILIALIHPLSEFHISMSQLTIHALGIIFFFKNTRFSYDLVALRVADDVTDPAELRPRGCLPGKICQRGPGAPVLGWLPRRGWCRVFYLLGCREAAEGGCLQHASGNLKMKNLAVC